jgi:hypothetical protein
VFSGFLIFFEIFGFKAHHQIFSCKTDFHGEQKFGLKQFQDEANQK